MLDDVSRSKSPHVVRGQGRPRRHPSYLVRRGDVYFFQIRLRLPRTLAPCLKLAPLRIRIGAVSLRLAQFEALRLAEAADALFAQWDWGMDVNNDSGQDQRAFPFIAEADAEGRAARETFLAELSGLAAPRGAATDGETRCLATVAGGPPCAQRARLRLQDIGANPGVNDDFSSIV